uniref:A kinase anchor protein 9 n=1 Tax=Romanomermis culicivorax TaxID=13658 RepID=A0A915JJ21_ROMCU
LIDGLSTEKAEIAKHLSEIESRFVETKSNYLLANEQLNELKSQYENQLERRQLDHDSEIRDLKMELVSLNDAFEKEKHLLRQQLCHLEDDRKRDELHMDEKLKNLRVSYLVD